MKFIVLAGRILFSVIFVMSAPNLFSKQSIGYAASQGTPMADVFVPIAGVLALLGGLSALFGFQARWGAWLLVLFLVPVTLIMHRFWGLSDPQAAMMQMISFMKNVSMTGGALLIAYFGSGPFSVDSLLHRVKTPAAVHAGA
jgi:putative oxidoreductase